MGNEMIGEYLNALSSCDGCIEVAPGRASGCTLRKEAQSPVKPEGNTQSKFWIIGRNPGTDEDKLGRPFVGPGGKCLDRMISRAGLRREDFWITNLCKCCSKDDRPPYPSDALTCSNWLNMEYEILKPKLAVLLGNQVVHAFFPNTLSVSTTHGTHSVGCPAAEFKHWETVFIFCNHPGYVVRKGLNFEKEQDPDWQRVKQVMEALNV